jgi:CCR4-NOT transcription complex subunit 6
MQVQMLLEELSALTSPKSKWYKVPTIVAGDFNSSVESGPYELLMNSKLKPRHLDLEPYVYGTYTTHGMSHQLSLNSAYAPIGEPQFTNYTANFSGVLDYIWYSQDRLEPI